MAPITRTGGGDVLWRRVPLALPGVVSDVRAHGLTKTLGRNFSTTLLRCPQLGHRARLVEQRHQLAGLSLIGRDVSSWRQNACNLSPIHQPVGVCSLPPPPLPVVVLEGAVLLAIEVSPEPDTHVCPEKGKKAKKPFSLDTRLRPRR